MGLFTLGRSRTPRSREANDRVAGWVRAELGLSESDAVTVSEIICGDPACPGTETVILVMRTGRRTQAAKVTKPVGEVTEDDVIGAVVDL